MLRTNVIRAEEHKDPKERAILVEKVKKATIMQDRIHKAVAMLGIAEPKTYKPNSESAKVKAGKTTKDIINIY